MARSHLLRTSFQPSPQKDFRRLLEFCDFGDYNSDDFDLEEYDFNEFLRDNQDLGSGHRSDYSSVSSDSDDEPHLRSSASQGESQRVTQISRKRDHNPTGLFSPEAKKVKLGRSFRPSSAQPLGIGLFSGHMDGKKKRLSKSSLTVQGRQSSASPPTARSVAKHIRQEAPGTQEEGSGTTQLARAQARDYSGPRKTSPLAELIPYQLARDSTTDELVRT